MTDNEDDPTPFPGHDLVKYGPGPGLGCATCGRRGAELSHPCGSRPKMAISLPFSPEDIATGRTVTRSDWRVERVDEDDGTIGYEVWSVAPVEWLFTVSTGDTPNAKAVAERIIKAVNAAGN